MISLAWILCGLASSFFISIFIFPIRCPILWSISLLPSSCFILSSWFLIFFFFNWRIVDLYCFSFRCMAKGLSFIYILFHYIRYRILLLQDIDYCSLCYSVSPCCLSTLYIVVWLHLRLSFIQSAATPPFPTDLTSTECVLFVCLGVLVLKLNPCLQQGKHGVPTTEHPGNFPPPLGFIRHMHVAAEGGQVRERLINLSKSGCRVFFQGSLCSY